MPKAAFQILTALSLLVVSPAFARIPKASERPPPEKEERRWENSPKGTLITRVGFVSPLLELRLSQNQGLGQEHSYRPNKGANPMLGMSYGGLGVSATSSGGSYGDENLYGKSTSSDFMLRYFGVRWGSELFFQRHKGYYLDNSKAIDPTITDAMYIRPDISRSLAGGNVYYNLNEDRFSMNGAFDYTRKQIKSGGAWLIVGSLRKEDFKASDSLIHPNEQAGYGHFNALREAELYQGSVGFGGAYNYVYGRFNLAGLMIANVCAQHSVFRLVGGKIESDALRPGSIAKIAIGFNGDNFIIGMVTGIDNTTAEVEEAEINFAAMESTFFAGYKFKDANLSWLDNFIEKYWPLSASEN